MRSDLRTVLAALAATAVLLGSATMALAADDGTVEPEPAASVAPSPPTPEPTSSATTPTPTPTETTPTPEPTPQPTPQAPSGAVTVADAQLRWGINDESNNRAFAPGTFNFFSAGSIPDPGRGGVIMPQSSWKQADGNVRIEKFLDGAWTPATWAGRQQTSTGATMSGTNGPFSNHQVVISGGTGTVDPAAGSASIQWRGSFTVIYYSGYSFFYVTDPRLTVTAGVGRLSGTLSGFGSSMEDLDAWKPVAPVADVTLADLGTVDLARDLGFTATPAYAGVAVSVGADQVAQVRSGSAWGSFPQSFIDYQLASGTGSYWYSSGGSADAHKIAAPVTVSYSSSTPVVVKPPSTSGDSRAEVVNKIREAPTDGAPTTPGSAPAAPPPFVAVPAADDVLQDAAAMTQARPVSTVTAAPAAPGSTSPTGVWILGGLLLGAAVLVTASPFAYTAVRRTDRPVTSPPLHSPASATADTTPER